MDIMSFPLMEADEELMSILNQYKEEYTEQSPTQRIEFVEGMLDLGFITSDMALELLNWPGPEDFETEEV